MDLTSKLTATTISLPFYYQKGKMVINEEEAEKLIKEAYLQGVRSFTTSPQYLDHACEEFLGRVLEPIRSNIRLSTNFPYFDETLPADNPFEFCLNRSLKDLRTHYVDCLYLYADCVELGLFDQQLIEAKKAKEEGKIKHIGIIFNPHNLFSAKDVMQKSNGIIDTVMIYFIPTIQEQKELLNALKDAEVTIVAGGLVDTGNKALHLTNLNNINDIENISATELAARYFMSQSVFNEVIFQLESIDFLNTVCGVARNLDKYSFNEIEKYFVQTKFNPENPRVMCCSCGYCSTCPKDIKINKIFNSYVYYDQYGMADLAVEVFKEYSNKVGGSIKDACINCGLCEKRCSHNTPIRENLKLVENFMKSLDITSTLK